MFQKGEKTGNFVIALVAGKSVGRIHWSWKRKLCIQMQKKDALFVHYMVISVDHKYIIKDLLRPVGFHYKKAEINFPMFDKECLYDTWQVKLTYKGRKD